MVSIAAYIRPPLLQYENSQPILNKISIRPSKSTSTPCCSKNRGSFTRTWRGLNKESVIESPKNQDTYVLPLAHTCFMIRSPYLRFVTD